MAKTVFMFSGQGSQYFQMGQELFAQDSVFKRWMLRLDDIVRDLSGNSVVEELYSAGHDKGKVFGRTLLTHPAIFMVEYSLAQSLIAANVEPEIVLGSSLGSFVAAALCGCVAVEDALTAVVRQASIVEANCEPGGMIAVLADPSLYVEERLGDCGELAGVSFATHFVISAAALQMEEIERRLRRRNVTYQRLPVAYAFHSRWIDPAKEPFEAFMRSIQTRIGCVPMMCCERAELLTKLPEGHFWRVTRSEIRFRDAIARLEQQGEYRYIDAGPAGTLANFLKYGLPASSHSTVHPILTPFGNGLKNRAALLARTVQ